jgi:hypothetical protein
MGDNLDWSMYRRSIRLGLVTSCLLAVCFAGSNAHGAGARTYGGYFSAERLENARINCMKYDWARKIVDETVAAAGPWKAKTDEELWDMVPGQDLPRCIDVTLTRTSAQTTRAGCLVCGDKINNFGDYPYNPDFEGRPWKLTCPSCAAVFPTNDFGAYYRSAIDARGLFNPARGDRRLLYNTAHPDPGDPLHLFGVDDGYGFTDAQGHTHKFIGYYVWKYWGHIQDGLTVLAKAYVFTGEPIYAHKAAVLLDRIADVYPAMNWKPYADRGWFHSDAGRGVGKIEGCIWETNVVRKLADSYDEILSGTVGDDALYTFLAGQARHYKLPQNKGTRDLFVQNVDNGILRTAYTGVLAGQISGNEGMQQLTVAYCALALNTNPETSRWLDWLFAADGGAIPGLLINTFDRDGMTDEAAPGYAVLGGELIGSLATRLAGYPLYRAHDLYAEYPQLRAACVTPSRFAALGVASPNLGDTGSTGLVTRAPANTAFCIAGFQATGDPTMALAAFRANGDSLVGLGEDVFSPAAAELAARIGRIAKEAGPRRVGGYLLDGYGLALLESGHRSGGTALVANYGRTLKHAHVDSLNFDLFAFGHWLAPDLGYPEFATAWPSRTEWTSNTLAHNTVFVDGQPQVRGWGGRAVMFAQTPGFGAFELDGQAAYPQLQDYRRTMLLVTEPDGENAYVVDIFHICGGADHVYSFHGPPGSVTTSGLHLEAQASGTYAGAAIPFGALSAGKFPSGYSYLYNVLRDSAPPPTFTVDWSVDGGYRGLKREDSVHLRLHVLGDAGDVALADGDPPQNKTGNPRRLGYLLLHHRHPSLASTFVSVIEPFLHESCIKSVEREPAETSRQVALRIEFTDGTIDRVLCNPTSAETLRLADGTMLSGKIGFLRQRAGTTQRAILAEGTALAGGQANLTSAGVWTGRVVRMNRDLQGGGWLVVDSVLPDDGSLIGRQIHIANDNERDATYTICAVTHDGACTRLDCGSISFIRGYAGPTRILRGQKLPISYEAGFLYDFEPGASFRIPLVTEWSPPAEGSGH